MTSVSFASLCFYITVGVILGYQLILAFDLGVTNLFSQRPTTDHYQEIMKQMEIRLSNPKYAPKRGESVADFDSHEL